MLVYLKCTFHLPIFSFIVDIQKDSITKQNKRTAEWVVQEFVAVCESLYYCVSSRKVTMIFLYVQFYIGHGCEYEYKLLLYEEMNCHSSSSSSGPGAHAPDALQPIGLLCNSYPPVILDVVTSAARRLHFHTTREILAAKGGTVGKNFGR
jgi:hypothetical protein